MTILNENDLKKYGKTFSTSKMAIALINHQKANWPLAAGNYASLRQVRTQTFDFGHFRIDCQFNPERIRSSAADTTASAIQARSCFLCEQNRPPGQAGITSGADYLILCNPYPIFSYHLTIPENQHLPQQLMGHVEKFLQLIRELKEFTVFYNGPKCGASAPDHFHFQAGIRDLLPVEDELDELIINHSESIYADQTGQVLAIDNYLRRMICFISTDPEKLSSWIQTALSALQKQDEQDEPMINLLGWFTNGAYRVVLFPRAAQRPREYFADEFDRILISPAAVELGGLIILPREEDFYKITKENLKSIFSQVTLQKEDYTIFKEKLIQQI
jgi:hypothetical protein